jgi:hypothetical protein
MVGTIRDWYVRSRAMTKLALVLIVGTYVASFFMPVEEVFSQPITGWDMFWTIADLPGELGRGNITGMTHFVLLWLANPILWFGIGAIIKEKGQWVLAGGCTAVMLALCAFFDFENMTVQWHKYHFGYYAWLGSMLATTWYGVFLLIAAPPLTPPHRTTAASDPSDRHCSSP